MIRMLKEEDAAYEEFLEKCQQAPAYEQIVKICNKYGYDVSDAIYIDKSGKVKYFNVSSNDDMMPKLRFDNNKNVHTISTTSFGNLTNDEFKELVRNYQNASKMLSELSEVDLNKLYKLK